MWFIWIVHTSSAEITINTHSYVYYINVASVVEAVKCSTGASESAVSVLRVTAGDKEFGFL